MRHSLIILAVMTGWCTFTHVSAGLPDTIDRIKPSIVGIGTFQSTRKPQLILHGTGFVVANGKHVMTNYHVISKELEISKDEHLVVIIGRGSKGKWYRLSKVALDPDHDLALLSFDGPTLPVLRIDKNKDVREGELYAFTGYPIAPILGLYSVTHQAIISAITPMVTPMNGSNVLTGKQILKLRGSSYNVYQLDANAYPGNSGSPVYDLETGSVIAILNSVYVKEYRENVLMKPSGISYAIPAKYIAEIIDQAELELSE